MPVFTTSTLPSTNVPFVVTVTAPLMTPVPANPPATVTLLVPMEPFTTSVPLEMTVGPA